MFQNQTAGERWGSRILSRVTWDRIFSLSLSLTRFSFFTQVNYGAPFEHTTRIPKEWKKKTQKWYGQNLLLYSISERFRATILYPPPPYIRWSYDSHLLRIRSSRTNSNERQTFYYRRRRFQFLRYSGGESSISADDKNLFAAAHRVCISEEPPLGIGWNVDDLILIFSARSEVRTRLHFIQVYSFAVLLAGL